LQETMYFKCSGCGYEFLSRSKTPICPKCKTDKLEKMDVSRLIGFDG